VSIAEFELPASRGSASRSRGENDNDARFGTATMTLNTANQRMDKIVIGVTSCPEKLTDAQTDCLADCVVRRQVALLTGYFGDNKEAVEKIAIKARAVHDMPLVQPFLTEDPQSRTGANAPAQFMPAYFVPFGKPRRVSQPKVESQPCWQAFHAKFKDRSRRADDLQDMMLPFSRLPRWPWNEKASVLLPSLGNLKTKPIDWARWIPHVHQVAVWYGTAIPSKSSQEKQAARRKGKDSGKGKDRSRGSVGSSKCNGIRSSSRIR
jgi:hypothetical protein